MVTRHREDQEERANRRVLVVGVAWAVARRNPEEDRSPGEAVRSLEAAVHIPGAARRMDGANVLEGERRTGREAGLHIGLVVGSHNLPAEVEAAVDYSSRPEEEGAL